MFKNFFKLFFSFLPDLTGFKELGFKVKTHNGDLFVERNDDHHNIRFYQGFEPFNPQLKGIVDFPIPDGLFIVEMKDQEIELIPLEQELKHVFKYVYLRRNFVFAFDDRLDFGTNGILIKVNKILKALEQLNY